MSEAARLRSVRETLGLSQRDFARELKVTHGAVASWETGERTLPGPVLKLLDLYEEEMEGGATERLVFQTSMLSRNFGLSRTAAAVAARGAAAWLEGVLSTDEQRNTIQRRTRLAIARQLVAKLGSMKGGAMKIGQMLSYVIYALPEEIQAEFASLQRSSRPMSPAQLAQVFMEDCGSPPRQLFAEWSPEPIAAASIGQVHRARLESGEVVAVKVQYPAVLHAIEADLQMISVFDKLGCLLYRNQEPGVFAAELRERFTEECDYRKEAANQEEFHRLWDGRCNIRVPRVHPEFTTRRILVTTFMEGESLDAFLEHATPEARNRAGETIWQFLFESALRHHVFQADPHAGNYLFTDDGVVALDYGCVKRLPPPFVAAWRDVLRAVLGRDRPQLEAALVRLGMIRDPARYGLDEHFRVLLFMLTSWLRDAPFRHCREFNESVWRVAMVDNHHRVQMNVPKDWFMVDRLYLGLNALLGKLETTANLRPRALDLLYEPGEPRPEAFSESELQVLGIQGFPGTSS